MNGHVENKVLTQRVKKGYTQKQLADAIGVSQSTYNNWENNFENVPIKKARLIATTLNINVISLIA